MNKQSDWNPEHYLKFRNERTQPSIDLVNRITPPFVPQNIIDIGCGPGNSIQVLLERWPQSKLVGIDNSLAMITKAKKDYPGQEWILSDVLSFTSNIRFDLVFCSATIQWIPDHQYLFDKFFSLLSPCGIIAIQVPRFNIMTIGKIIQSVTSESRWKSMTQECADLFTYHDSYYYYNLLSDKMKSIDMWETDYMHVLASHQEIIEWIESAGLKPYLNRIGDEADKHDFKQDILSGIKQHYSLQKNGKVLFPFKRLFFIGYK